MESFIDWIFRALVGALIIIAGVVWNDLKKKVDNSVSWDEFNRQCNQIDKTQDELKKALSGLSDKTDTLIEGVARIEGHLRIGG